MPAFDVVHSVLRYFRIMKAVPDFAGSTGAFEFVHIDTVSRDIARCAVISVSQGGMRGSDHIVIYLHHSGEEFVPVNQLKEHLEGSSVGSFKVAKLEDWVGDAFAVGARDKRSSGLLHARLQRRYPSTTSAKGLKVKHIVDERPRKDPSSRRKEICR